MIIRRLARPMLASIFVAGGLNAVRKPAPLAEIAQPFTDKALELLPAELTSRIPEDPVTLVRINGGVQVAGGILLATGKFPRLASAALAGTLVPTTLAGHPFWKETEPAKRQAQQTQFLKNLSLLGGLIIASADTAGQPGLTWRTKKAAAATSAALASAIPGSSNDSTTDKISALGSKASEQAENLAGTVAKQSLAAADIAKERAPGIIEAIKERAEHVGEIAQEKGSSLADLAKEKGAEIAEVAQDKGTKWGDVAAERGADLANTAQKRGLSLASTAQSKGAELAASAQTNYEHSSKKVAKKAKKNAKKFDKVAKSTGKDVKAKGRKLASQLKDDAPGAAQDKAGMWLAVASEQSLKTRGKLAKAAEAAAKDSKKRW